MFSLLFGFDVMKYPDNRLTHVLHNRAGFDVDEHGARINVLRGRVNQIIGGEYLCGAKGSITEISSGIGSWVQLEDIITVAGTGVYTLFCKECLNEASFILGVTSD